MLRPNAEARTKYARLMIAGERKTHLLRACFVSTYSPRNAFNDAASKTYTSAAGMSPTEMVNAGLLAWRKRWSIAWLL